VAAIRTVDAGGDLQAALNAAQPGDEDYGVFGGSIGTSGLAALTRSYQWTHNVLAGGAGYTYPGVTWLPTVAVHRAHFNPDYSLVPSQYLSWRGYRQHGSRRLGLQLIRT
jgi:hypothetical protein